MTESPNPYSPPRVEVSNAQTERTDDRPSVGARFLWAASVSFVFFMVLIMLVLPRHEWIYGGIGSAMFAALSGLIAMCIPVKSKAGFIIPAVLVSFFLAYLLGSRSHDSPLPDPQAVEK